MSGRRNGVNTGIQTYKRKDGYWVARIEAGWTSKGTRYRPAVVRKTEAAARAKAREMLREYNKGGQDAVRGRNGLFAIRLLRDAEKVVPGHFAPV